MYRSSIPKTARERVVERYPDGAKKQAEYWLKRKQVGTRWFYENGEPELEYVIERDWNVKGGMRRGFPKFWMNGKQMTRGEYLKAQGRDKSLPKYSARDNASKRRLPNAYRGLK